MSERYKIIRNYFNRPGARRTLYTDLTLEQAQAHCADPNTSSRTATSAAARAVTRRNGPWFDGYTQQ